MGNLNRTIKEAAMPTLSAVTAVNRKFLYSLCAVLFLLMCSLSTKAQYGSGPSDLYSLPYDLGFGTGQSTFFSNPQCTSCSPFTNSYGNPYHSGNDKWIKIEVKNDGYLSIIGGTANYDSAFHLLDSAQNLITYADDGTGSGDNIGHGSLQPWISYLYVTAGTYILVVDGSDKYLGGGSSWTSASGSVNITFRLD
ncbi:MAG: hypothetical protein V4619_00570 [Bacteroidota bacterium]